MPGECIAPRLASQTKSQSRIQVHLVDRKSKSSLGLGGTVSWDAQKTYPAQNERQHNKNTIVFVIFVFRTLFDNSRPVESYSFCTHSSILVRHQRNQKIDQKDHVRKKNHNVKRQAKPAFESIVVIVLFQVELSKRRIEIRQD